MNGMLTIYLGDLAESLRELRGRFRQAARLEVARTVGETLQELALTAIGGGRRAAPSRVQGRSSWGDPWQEDLADDVWHTDGATDGLETEAPDGANSVPPLRAALVFGVGAARWGYCRTRNPVVAILVGAVVVVIVLVGGPTVEALAEAWTTATDLVGFTAARMA